MKSTIKIDASRAITITPDVYGINICFSLYGAQLGGASLTPEQCHAVISALELAMQESARAAG